MAWIPLAAAGISAAASFFGQKDTNASNTAMSQQQMQFNSEEAEKSRQFSAAQAAELRDWQSFQAGVQRAWSEDMSSTSYQRAVGDLQKAGLNPMLAYSQGGAPMPSASAPSGAMGTSSPASYSNIPLRSNAAAVAVNSAVQAMQVTNMAKQGANIDADTALKNAQAQQTLSSAGNLEASTEEIKARIPKYADEIRLLKAQEGSAMWDQTVKYAQSELLRVQSALEGQRIGAVEADTQLTKIKTLLANLAEPEARNAANAQESWWMRNISPYLPDVLKSTGAVGGVRGLLK